MFLTSGAQLEQTENPVGSSERRLIRCLMTAFLSGRASQIDGMRRLTAVSLADTVPTVLGPDANYYSATAETETEIEVGRLQSSSTKCQLEVVCLDVESARLHEEEVLAAMEFGIESDAD